LNTEPVDDSQLLEVLQTEQSLRVEIMQTADETNRLAEEARRKKKTRDSLSLLKATLEEQIADKTGELDDDARAEFDLRRQLAETEAALEQLKRRREQVDAQPRETVVLQNYPTALSRTVHGEELHFQVRDGRIAYVPLQELVDRLPGELQRVRSAMLRSREYTDTVGPIGGFRMRYTFRRHDAGRPASMQGAVAGSVVRLELAEFLPTSSRIGEPIELALEPDSAFRQRLAKAHPGRATVTLWVYPDSFEPFRSLRELLHQQEFSVAARPLPEGVPISGSPDGTKSAAE